MRNKETNVLLGARHVTTAKVLATLSLNAKIFMHLTNPMIMRKILMVNGSWLSAMEQTVLLPHLLEMILMSNSNLTLQLM